LEVRQGHLYLKNLYRLEQAERRINWAEAEVRREMQKIGLTPDECYCSFCGKPSAEAQKMIAGPHDVFICDECVDLCGEILEEEMGSGTDAGSDDEKQDGE